VWRREPCFGPKFDKHKHLYDDQNHAFAMLLKRIRESIKRHKPDGALVINSGMPMNIPTEYWKYVDADMLESYICTWVSKDRLGDWKKDWYSQGSKLNALLDAGKQIQALSYLGYTPYGLKEDAFFCFASSRLAGFVWSGDGAFDKPATAALYQTVLGPPLGEVKVENGVHWRAFANGLAAVNPEKDRSGVIPVKPPISSQLFYDIADSGADRWSSYERGGYVLDLSEKRSGCQSARCVNVAVDGKSGLSQTVALKQEKPADIVVSGWSKAENVSGKPDSNYSIYVDVQYQDGTNLYGQNTPFACGTHDWQFVSVTIHPQKPIKNVVVHALFRDKSGKVWFDDLSLQSLDVSNRPRQRLANGSLEEAGCRGRLIDVAHGGKLVVPPCSGRVFLYVPPTTHELEKRGTQLTIATEPGLGEVCIRVDGFDYWTHCGRWGIEYMLEGNFGTVPITFDKPGKHVVEVIDVVARDMKTPAGYSSAAILGEAMDPSNPTKPSTGKFRFRGWKGAVTSKDARIEVDVSGDTKLRAVFEKTE
jgi:hypothetical protein